MPNGGFRVGIKTGLGLVKQTEGEQKRKLEDEKITICLGVKVRTITITMTICLGVKVRH